MAERKKISELDFAQSVSSDDEFLMIDKSVVTGDEASESGKTSKVTLNQIKDGIFASGLPQGDKGEKGQQGASVTGPQGSQGASVTGAKGQKGQQGASVTGAKGSQGASITGSKGQKGQQGASVTGPQGPEGSKGTSIKGEPGVGSDGDSFFTQTDNGISYNAGNIAVGTSSTTAKLEVQGDFRVSRNSIYSSHWHMGISHTDTSDYGTLGFYSNSDTGDVAFYPDGTEVFRIKSTGNVGIGTDDPTYKVDVHSDSVGLRLRNPASAGVNLSNDAPSILFEASGWDTDAGSQVFTGRIRVSGLYSGAENRGNTHPVMVFDLETNENNPDDVASPKMAIGIDAVEIPTRLGIGHSAASFSDPKFGLDIRNKNGIAIRDPQSTQNSQTNMIRTSTSSTNSHDDWGVGINVVNEDTANNGYGMAFWTRDKYNGSYSEKMRLDHDGNVGIGTDDPDFKLTVDNGIGNEGLKVIAGNNGDASESVLEAWNNKTNGSAPDMLFKVQGDGNIGIGTESSSGGMISAGKSLEIKSSEASVLRLNRVDDQDVAVQDYSLYAGSLAFSIHDNIENASRLIIKSGNVGIGTLNPNTVLDINQPKNDSDGNPLNKDVLMTFSKGETGEAKIGLSGGPSQVLIGASENDLCIRSDGNDIKFGTAAAERTDMTIDTEGNVFLGSNFEYDTENLTLGGKLIGNQNLSSTSGSVTSVGYELDAEYGLTLGNGVYLGEPKLRIFRGHDEPEQSIEMSAEGITLNNSNNLAESQSSFSIKQKGDDGERTPFMVSSNGTVDMMNTRIANDGVQIYNETSIFMQSSSATNASFIRRLQTGLSIFNSATSAGNPLNLAMPVYVGSSYGGLSVVNTANEEMDLAKRISKSPEEFELLEGGQINLAYAGTRPSYVGETTGSWSIDSKPFDKSYADYDALRFFTKDLNDNNHTPFAISPNGATVSNRGRFVADDRDGVREILDVDNPMIMLGQEALKVESGNAYQIGVSNIYSNGTTYNDETEAFDGIGKGYMGVDSNGFFRICGNGNNIDHKDSAIGTSLVGGVGLMDGEDEIARFQSENIALHNSVTFHDKTTSSTHAAITRNGFSLSKTWDSDPNLRAVVLDSDLGGQSHILGSLGVNISSIGMNNVDKLQVNGSSTLDGNVTVSNISGKVAEFKDDEIVFHKPVSGAGANFPGMITAAAVLNAPVGWHECNGELLLKFDYLNLWNAIGDSYALPTDTDISMFRLPDLRGRVIAGVDSLVNGSYANNLMHSTDAPSRPLSMIGETDGADKHTLTEEEMPSHTHEYNRYGNPLSSGGISLDNRCPESTRTTGATGGDQPHNNVQPTMVLSYFIKL